jgi:large subunit ribosomal protein L3
MAGHMGDVRVTQQNLEILETDVARGLVFVKGSIPGATNSFVLIQDAVKSLSQDLPFPGSVVFAAPAQDVQAPSSESEAAVSEPALSESSGDTLEN